MNKNPNKRFSLLHLLLILWVASVAFGSVLMLRHEFGAGGSLPAPATKPDQLAQYFTNQDCPLTIVISIHPDCPCTGASLEQLDRFLTQHEGKAQAVAFFTADENAGESEPFASNSYWQRVQRMPGAVAVVDSGGKQALSFGALVSGAVAAYDSEGKLRFQGGLTPSRGHAGSSRGMDLLSSIAFGKPVTELGTTPSFGCSLTKDKDT